MFVYIYICMYMLTNALLHKHPPRYAGQSAAQSAGQSPGQTAGQTTVRQVVRRVVCALFRDLCCKPPLPREYFPPSDSRVVSGFERVPNGFSGFRVVSERFLSGFRVVSKWFWCVANLSEDLSGGLSRESCVEGSGICPGVCPGLFGPQSCPTDFVPSKLSGGLSGSLSGGSSGVLIPFGPKI